MTKKPITVYFAVRESKFDGYEWLDTRTASGALDVCRNYADKTNREIPNWAEANPVVRFTSTVLTNF